MTVRCKDCVAEGVTTVRPIDPASGPRSPRCATHTRARRKAISSAAHARAVESKFELTADEYWAIYETQGRRCAICTHATGKSKRLAVDHDHKMAAEVCGHDPKRGCRRCIRGLLCSRCNRWGVPLFLDAVIRAIEYLSNPPARKVLL